MICSDSSHSEGLRILVVEDDFLVARSLEVLLDSLGCTVIGPASSVDEALDLLKRIEMDAAILDINLSPGTSAPIARALRLRGHPFAFITGYSNLNMLPDDLRGYRVLHKPVDRQTLESTIAELARRSNSGAG